MGPACGQWAFLDMFIQGSDVCLERSASQVWSLVMSKVESREANSRAMETV